MIIKIQCIQFNFDQLYKTRYQISSKAIYQQLSPLKQESKVLLKQICLQMSDLLRKSLLQSMLVDDYKLNPDIIKKKPEHTAVMNYMIQYLTESIFFTQSLLNKELKCEVKGVDRNKVRSFTKKVIKLSDTTQIIKKFRQYLVAFANFRFVKDKEKPDLLAFAKMYAMVLRCLDDFNNKEDLEFTQALSTMNLQQMSEHIRKNSKSGSYFKPLQQRSLRQQLIEYGLKIKAVGSLSHSTLYSGTKKCFYTALEYMAKEFRTRYKINMDDSFFQFHSLKDIFQKLIKVTESIKESYYLRKWLVKAYNAVNGDPNNNMKKRIIPIKKMIRIYNTFLIYRQKDGKEDKGKEPKQIKKVCLKKPTLWRKIDDWKIKQLLKEDVTYKDIADLLKMQARYDSKICSRRIMIRTKGMLTCALMKMQKQAYVQKNNTLRLKQVAFLLKNLVNGFMRKEVSEILSFNDSCQGRGVEAGNILRFLAQTIMEEQQKERQKMQRERLQNELRVTRQRQKEQQDRYERQGPHKDNKTEAGRAKIENQDLIKHQNTKQ